MGVPFLDVLRQLIEQGKAAPFQCEAPPTPFIGYADLLARAQDIVVRSKQSVVVVSGAQGSGVTSFLRQLAHGLRDTNAFSGGVFVVGLEAAVATDAGLSAVCKRVQARQTGRTLHTDLKDWCCSRPGPVVVIVDCGHSGVARWREVLEPCSVSNSGKVPIVWVFGSSSGSSAAATVKLSGLEGAVEVLDAQCGELVSTVAPELKKFAARIGKRCGYMPGLIAQFCRLGVVPAMKLLEAPGPELAAAGGAGSDVSPECSVGSAIMSGLTDEEKHILRSLLVFPGVFTADAATEVVGRDVSAVLDMLCTVGLCRINDGRWSVVKAHTASLDAPDSSVLPRFVSYVGKKLAAVVRMYRSAFVTSALAAFDAERDNFDALLKVLFHWGEQGEPVRRALLEIPYAADLLQARLPMKKLSKLSKNNLHLQRVYRVPQSLSDALQLRGAVSRLMSHSSNFDKVLKIYEECLHIRKALYKSDQHALVADVINDMALLHEEHGDFAKALELHRVCLHVRKEVCSGTERHSVADSQNNIALLLAQQATPAAFDEAMVKLKKSLEIYRTVFGEQHPRVALCLGNIATVLQKQGKLDKALKLHRKSLKIREAVYGPQHHAVALSYYNIGSVQMQGGNLDAALEAHRKCLAIREKVFDRYFNEDVAQSMYAVGVVLAALKKWEEALERYRECLKMRRAAHGEKHALVAETLFAIGTVLESEEKPEKLHSALASYRECLFASEAAWGRQSAGTAKALRAIGLVQEKLGHVASALEKYDESVAAAVGAGPAACSEAEESLAAKAAVVVVRDGMRAAFKACVVAQQQMPGVSAADAMLLAVGRLTAAGRHHDALQVFRVCVSVLKPAYSAKHKFVMDALPKVANAGDIADSSKLFLYCELLKLGRTVCGAKCSSVATTLKDIGDTLVKLGRSEEALQCYIQSLEMRKALSPDNPDSREVASSMNAVGKVLFQLGRLNDALEKFSEAAAMYDRLTLRPEGCVVYLEIGDVLEAIGGRDAEALRYYEAGVKGLSARFAKPVGPKIERLRAKCQCGETTAVDAVVVGCDAGCGVSAPGLEDAAACLPLVITEPPVDVTPIADLTEIAVLAAGGDGDATGGSGVSEVDVLASVAAPAPPMPISSFVNAVLSTDESVQAEGVVAIDAGVSDGDDDWESLVEEAKAR